MDLYYRINVGRVELPPLRDRGEDIAILTSHFLKQFAVQMNREDIEMDPEVFEVLKYYPWPGNVRELQNIVKRTITMANSNRIGVDDLPDDIVIAAGGGRTDTHKAGFFKLREQHVAGFERHYLAGLLDATGGDVSQAAEQAQVPRGTFYRLMKKNNLDPESFR
jgi:DNA-binding NtrC family response regulator